MKNWARDTLACLGRAIEWVCLGPARMERTRLLRREPGTLPSRSFGREARSFRVGPPNVGVGCEAVGREVERSM